MQHTPQIKRAIQYAARKHHGQFRAETEPLPYITHLVSVALLVTESEHEDNIIIAALLHDVLEDTDATRNDIVTRFGERVAHLVEEVTEIKEYEGRTLTWHERKEQYLFHLETASEDAILIALADKIDNVESKLEALHEEGKGVLGKWSQSQDRYLWFHGAVLNIAQRRLPQHILTERLRRAHEQEQDVLKKFAAT